MFKEILNTLTHTLALYKHRSHSRRALLKLNSSQLSDIGLTAEQAQREGNKPFWIGESQVIRKALTQASGVLPPHLRVVT